MKNIFSVFALIFSACLFFGCASAQTPDYPPYSGNSYSGAYQGDAFHSFLEGVAEDAIADGVNPAVAHNALAQAELDERVIERDQNQPEQTLTFTVYREHTVNPDRVSEGRVMMRQHGAMLRNIAKRYGVPPEIIVALWGMESGF